MSDTSRQSLSERAKAAAIPDALKSDERVAHEEVRGKTDKAQAFAQPESEKSYMQQAADKIRDTVEGSHTSPASYQTHTTSTTASTTHEEDKGLFEKAKEMFTGGSTDTSRHY